MLRQLGAQVKCQAVEGGAQAITVTGQPELNAANITVPSDLSAAAFPLIAALLVPGSQIEFQDVGVNPLRTGLLDCLSEMGAHIDVQNLGAGDGGEEMANISATSGPLKGIEVPPERVPAMIDEFPILAMAAACADGPTRFMGVGELRVKESDRIGAIADGLKACGVSLQEDEGSLIINGSGVAPAGGASVASRMDHRIAMSFAVLGMVSDAPIRIDDASPIATSFPGFVPLMNGLGGDLHLEEDAR